MGRGNEVLWAIGIIFVAAAIIYCGIHDINPATAVLDLGFSAYDFTTRGVRLSKSTNDGNGNIKESPQVLADAASIALDDPSVTLDVYTVARMLRSEAGSRPAGGKILRAHVAINDSLALGRTLYDTITAGASGYGKQAPRRYSTSQDPYTVDYQIALAVVNSRNAGGDDLASGAVKFVNTGGLSAARFVQVQTDWAKEGLAPIDPIGDNPESDLVLFGKVT